MKGEKGETGSKGAKGDTGESGAKGEASPQPLSNWKQCVWKYSESKDNGLIRVRDCKKPPLIQIKDKLRLFIEH